MDQDASVKSSGQKPAARTFASDREFPRPSIPDHELVRCIGSGSYGIVWLARHKMGMCRAVKIVYRKSFDHDKPFERELSGIRKFEPISRLHEGFIDVLHIGLNERDEYFYYVMELGDDEKSGQVIDPAYYTPKTLAGEIKVHGKLSAAACLQLGLALTQAVSELHKRGLVHRDIKPSNIIFVNGVPKLADIGLVAEIDQARSYVGTEGFIPPEGPGAPQADVYGLGKVLYEASTGKDRQDFPELPTQWDKGDDHEVFLELNEVILRACKSDPNKRYQTAEEMHADLVLLMNGKSVKRLRLLEQRLKRLKRIGLLSSAALFVLGIVGFQVYREWRASVESHEQRVGASVAYGNRAMESGDFTGALPYFTEALQLDRGNPSREVLHRLRIGSVLGLCPKILQMWSGEEQANSGEISPDGTKALVARASGSAEIYDIQSGKRLAGPFGLDDEVARAAYSPDGHFIVTAGLKGVVSIWNSATLEKICLNHPKAVENARFSRDGSQVVTACRDGCARIWNPKTGALERTLKRGTNSLIFADFNRDGSKVVTTSRDCTASVWDANDGRLLVSGMRHPEWVTYAGFSPDGERLVTACEDKSARVWDVRTGQRILPDLKHDGYVWSAQFSPDGRWILTGSLDGTVRLWSAETLQPLPTNPVLWHGERVTHASFSADGGRIISTCADGSVRIWDLSGCVMIPQPVSAAFSLDRNRYLLVTNNAVEVYDTVLRTSVSPIIEDGTTIKEAILNRDGKFVLIAGTLSNRIPIIEIRDSATGKRRGSPLALTNHLSQLRLGDDGRQILAFDSETANLWDVNSGRRLTTISAPGIRSAAFSRSGNAMLTWGGDIVRGWDSTTGRELFPAIKNPVFVKHVEFSHDGSRFVTCGADIGFTKCSAQVWITKTGRPAGPALQHGDGVLWASFNADGSRIVTGGEDNVAILWDVATGKRLQVMKHDNQVRMTAFSPSGRWIVTACVDGTARIWSAETGDPLTPRLQHLSPFESAVLLRDEHTLVTRNSKGDKAWLWHIPEESRPVEDLARLSRLLSGGMTTAQPGTDQAGAETIQDIWKDLRGKYPSTFATSTNDLAAWHKQQAAISKSGTNSYATDFHLQWLHSLRQDSQIPTQSVTRIQAGVKNGN